MNTFQVLVNVHTIKFQNLFFYSDIDGLQLYFNMIVENINKTEFFCKIVGWYKNTQLQFLSLARGSSWYFGDFWLRRFSSAFRQLAQTRPAHTKRFSFKNNLISGLLNKLQVFIFPSVMFTVLKSNRSVNFPQVIFLSRATQR